MYWQKPFRAPKSTTGNGCLHLRQSKPIKWRTSIQKHTHHQRSQAEVTLSCESESHHQQSLYTKPYHSMCSNRFRLDVLLHPNEMDSIITLNCLLFVIICIVVACECFVVPQCLSVCFRRSVPFRSTQPWPPATQCHISGEVISIFPGKGKIGKTKHKTHTGCVPQAGPQTKANEQHSTAFFIKYLKLHRGTIMLMQALTDVASDFG